MDARVPMRKVALRPSGDWWDERPYSRDDYRAHFEGLDQAWVLRDARDGCCFLQGLFD